MQLSSMLGRFEMRILMRILDVGVPSGVPSNVTFWSELRQYGTFDLCDFKYLPMIPNQNRVLPRSTSRVQIPSPALGNVKEDASLASSAFEAFSLSESGVPCGGTLSPFSPLTRSTIAVPAASRSSLATVA